jgi:tRNA-Thr(GGU) m(6)t(6)A37 methyltransferase TsaA
MHLRAIGIIRTPYSQAAGTPVQPVHAAGNEGRAELKPEFVSGLRDLAGFDRVWLLFWCHRAAPAKLTVVPYLDTVERGVFATRAPARPNPIGLSCVRLLGIEGGTLRLGDVDILDGSPLLDIKPYVSRYDHYAVERCGWVDAAPERAVMADGRFERGE